MANKLFYEIKGQGQPLVFLHGNTLDHRMWRYQVKHFSKTFKTITIDLTGFGKSPKPTENYSYEFDLLNLFEELNFENIILVGLSFGGEIALNIALEKPSLISKLILIDASLGGYKSTVDWDIGIDQLSLDKAKENWIKHEVFKKSLSFEHTADTVAPIIEEYDFWHWFKHDIHRIKPRFQAINELKNITIPTLIVIGDKDLNYYHNIADLINRGIKKSTLHIIEDTGHLASIDKYSEVNQLIEKFIA